jgi:propanol-preferring alcohol dehydrogenase
MVCIGTLNLENTIHMKMGIRKRLSIIFSYGGQLRDLKDVLDLISKRAIQPQVEPGQIKDFAVVLKQLCAGQIKARVALVHE